MKSKENLVFGLIGYPVEHSLSPLMHNTAFKELGIDAAYKLFSLKEDELDKFFAQLRQKDSPIAGLNVTVPYKEKVIKYLDGLSPYAQETMAVNTIVINEKRKTNGFNTDGPGFLVHLTKLGFNTEGKRIAILGAGGAARAIVSVLCLLSERPATIRIYDIDKGKARYLIDDLKTRLDTAIVEAVDSVDDLNIELADLLVNATPVGMKETDLCLIEEDIIHKNLLVYDLIYNPAQTKLLKMAKKKGAKVSNGLGLLFCQGVLSFQHWANTELDDKVKNKMWKSLTNGLKK